MKGTVAGAGSNSRSAAFVFNWYRVLTALAVDKGHIDTAFNTSICNPIWSALNARFTQTYNTVRYVNNWLDQPVRFAHAHAGSITGDSMPTTCSAFIELTTGLRYSFNRGSKKLFPMSETDTTTGSDDMFNAACVTRLTTIASAIVAGFTDSDGNIWAPVILSTKYSQLGQAPAMIYATPVTGATVSSRIGSMRHRKVKSLLV
jgi:hypothetical protein